MRSLRRLVVASVCLSLVACGGSGTPAEAISPERLAEIRQLSSAYSGRGVDALVDDAEALALGSELFAAHCADCHRSDGTGNRGVTDLTAGRYDYGATPDAISATIREGRHSEMPGFGDQYNEFGVGQLVSFVASLDQGDESAQRDSDGREYFIEACAACHGENGQGQVLPGASDLTDNYWQYGDSMTNVRSIITNGIEATCPAHADQLSAEEIDLLTAFVASLASSR